MTDGVFPSVSMCHLSHLPIMELKPIL